MKRIHQRKIKVHEKVIAAAAMAAGCLFGQTTVDLRSQARNVDFSQAASTRPHKLGVTLPAACVAGETFFKTDALPGQNVFGCTAPNIWSPLGSAAVSAGSGVTAVNGQVSTDDAVVPFYAVGNGAPSLACQPGRDFYTDLTARVLYSCVATDTWNQAGGGGADGSILALAPSASMDNERVLIPRDGLASIDGGANSTYTVDWNPLDRGLAWAVEDFLTGNVTSGNLGAMGISRNSVGTSGSVSYPASPAGHPGVLRLTTAATASSGEWISAGSVFSPYFSVASADWAATEWDVQAILSPGANSTTLSNLRMRTGLGNGASTATGSLGIFVRYDTALGDTTLRYQICGSVGGCGLAASGADSQVADSGVTPVAGAWYRIRIRRVSNGVGGNPTVYFTINESNQRTFCASGCDATLTAMPTVGNLILQVGYFTDTAAAKSCDIDWFAYRIRGLSRN
ncbi:MAG: hypothetical protein R2762_28255 [Bryobacteraceae bacterium]